jgi:4-hydroxy-3-polyprenylbenzoate decarboxylase
MAIIQFEKTSISDEGRQRKAALTALTAYQELKQVIVVDEDVNIFGSDHVLWAMNTRYQGDVSTIFIPGARCHKDDPSQSPKFNSRLKDYGITCKATLTVQYHLKAKSVLRDCLSWKLIWNGL